MLTFRDEKKDRFYFKNLDRIHEREIFLKAKSILENDMNTKFINYIEIVELDIWEGKYKDVDFQLCYDINYGPFLICKNEDILEQLEKLINKE